MPTVLLTRPLPDGAMRTLQSALDVRRAPEPLDVPGLHAAVKGCDGIVCLLTEKIDAALLDAAGSSLKVVSNVAVGYDNIDVAAAKARGVIVTNTPNVLTNATAELT